jgi:hypothetical protein
MNDKSGNNAGEGGCGDVCVWTDTKTNGDTV